MKFLTAFYSLVNAVCMLFGGSIPVSACAAQTLHEIETMGEEYES